MAENARRQELKQSYDCVVIGAGNGGLAAAAQLAARGAKVLLLEQHHSPGGFATSFVRGRFEFEASLHAFAEIGPPESPATVRSVLEDELGVHLDWVEIPEAYRLIVTDPAQRLDVTIHYGVQAFTDEVERAAPGSRESVTRYVDLCREVYEALAYIGQSRGQPDRSVLTHRYANFLKTCPYTMDQVADAVGLAGKARTIVQALWVYLGPPTSRASFTLYAAMLYSFLKNSAYIPRRRSHELSLALDRRIRELGGDIAYHTRADEILVGDGRVEGVVTSRGDRVKTRHVISNASPLLVYGRLISPRSAVPEIALKECSVRINGVSAMVVYLGLDASPEELGLKEYDYVIVGSSDSARSYSTFGTLDATMGQAAACLNNAVPDCSPPGTSIVSITTLFRPEAWQGLSSREYVRTKNRIAGGLIAQFEHATGTTLRHHVEEIEVSTPVTYARYTGSRGGTIYGYEPEPWDAVIPRLMSFRNEVHFQGLEFCGGYAFRCHGYSSSFMSGQTVALLTLKDLIDKGEIRP